MIRFFKKYARLPFLLLIIIVFAFLLRILWLPENLFFGFEQGRDLFAVRGIATLQDLKLLGPPSDLADEGIYHGAAFYYLLVPLYLIGRGDPFIVVLGLVLLNIAGIVFLYKAVEEFFDKRTAVLTALLFAVSYAAVVYSRWISNPAPIQPAVALMLYFLSLSRKKPRYLVGAVLCFGAVMHFSLATAATLVLPIIAFLIIWKIKVSKWLFVLCLAAVLIFFLPYIIFDLRNNFIFAKSLLNIFHSLAGRSGGENALNQVLVELSDSILPKFITVSTIFLAFILGINLLRFKSKSVQTFLFFLIGSILPFLIFSISPARHIFVHVPIFFAVLAASAVNVLFQKYGKIALIIPSVLVITNLNTLIPVSKDGVTFLYNSQRTYLGEMKLAVDYIYHDAQGRQFSYDYFTVPWWRAEAWRYLFSWHGKNKYGYEPENERTRIFYVIIEPDLTSKSVYKDNWYGEYKKDKVLLDSKQFRWLTIEKRVLR